MALEKPNEDGHVRMGKDAPIFTPELLHEVFFTPGLFLLFAGHVFATLVVMDAHLYGMTTSHPSDTGIYVLISVLCGAAASIAVQRRAIPEASPTLPLEASLGLTFSY